MIFRKLHLGSEVPEDRGESVCYETAEAAVNAPLGKLVSIFRVILKNNNNNNGWPEGGRISKCTRRIGYIYDLNKSTLPSTKLTHFQTPN